MGSAARGQPSYGARAETRPTEHRARRQPLRATFPSQGRRGKRPSTDVGKRRIGDQEARPQRFPKNRCGREAGCVRAGGAATNGRHPAKPSSSTSTTAAGFGSAATPTQVQAGAQDSPAPPSPVPGPSGEPGASPSSGTRRKTRSNARSNASYWTMSVRNTVIFATCSGANPASARIPRIFPSTVRDCS